MARQIMTKQYETFVLKIDWKDAQVLKLNKYDLLYSLGEEIKDLPEKEVLRYFMFYNVQCFTMHNSILYVFF